MHGVYELSGKVQSSEARTRVESEAVGGSPCELERRHPQDQRVVEVVMFDVRHLPWELVVDDDPPTEC
jgi:hypothetical protein